MSLNLKEAINIYYSLYIKLKEKTDKAKLYCSDVQLVLILLSYKGTVNSEIGTTEALLLRAIHGNNIFISPFMLGTSQPSCIHEC